MTRRVVLCRSLYLACLLPLLALPACRANHVQITIQNHTGAAIHILEVDYPNASFGADQIASGGEYHYRVQVRGSSALKVSYTGPQDKQYQITGPELNDSSNGTLQIVLLPGGKAEFHPSLSVAH